ncbi:MAG TPA: hypothetical protein VGS11_04925 [Candidatus Bathyarchaeia archaeon]|nr:hypothetical protein [Candidatus Bathyarchaeia archaeon]
MRTKPVRLKNGKQFSIPAVFLTPESVLDGKVLREVNGQFPETPAGMGLERIEGFTVYAKDWDRVVQGLKPQPTLEAFYSDNAISRRPIEDRPFIVLPELDFALRGSQPDRKKMLELGLISEKQFRAIEQIALESKLTHNQRLDRTVDEVYPLLDTTTLVQSLRFQLDRRTSILAMPSVSVTSVRKFDSQMEKAREMIRNGHTLLRDVFTGFYGKVDVLNILTVGASVLKPENYPSIFSLLISYAPDHIGLRIVGLDKANDSQVSNVFNTISELHTMMEANDIKAPIHVFNMDHLGYVGWCYGMSVLSMPISTDPYFFGRRSDETPPKDGVFYNIEDMTYDTHEELLRKTRPNYELPCYCGICQKYKTIPKVKLAMKWNDFRRRSEVLCRNIELKEIREAPARIDEAIKQKLLRSRKLGWTQFIPDKPVIAFAETEA